MVQGAVGTVNRFSKLLGRLSPETRGEVKTMAAPFIGMAIAGYIALPPQMKSDIGPIMKSLNSIKW